MAGAVAGGLGIAVFAITWETSLAQRIPPEALSRVSSYDWMGSLALIPVGYLGAGLVARSIDPSTVTVAGGLGLFALLAAGLIPRETRDLRRLPPGLAPGAPGEPPALDGGVGAARPRPEGFIS